LSTLNRFGFVDLANKPDQQFIKGVKRVLKDQVMVNKVDQRRYNKQVESLKALFNTLIELNNHFLNELLSSQVAFVLIFLFYLLEKPLVKLPQTQYKWMFLY
jgi:hypothetical protein